MGSLLPPTRPGSKPVRPAGERSPRRSPQQSRSRGRVERVLEVTAQLVVDGGVGSVNTRAIAAAADIPVASVYQYFADKDEILLALVEQDLRAMDREVEQALGRLSVLTVRGLVETTIRAFVTVFRQRPAFVVIWLRGRTNPAVDDFCRAHNRTMAHRLFDLARTTGMVLPTANGRHAELAVEVADRLLQVAFESSLEGDPYVIDEAVAAVTSYLERHASPAGLAGVPVDPR
jgi:AcrR family transcriptional regulator